MDETSRCKHCGYGYIVSGTCGATKKGVFVSMEIL